MILTLWCGVLCLVYPDQIGSSFFDAGADATENLTMADRPIRTIPRRGLSPRLEGKQRKGLLNLSAVFRVVGRIVFAPIHHH